MEAARKALIVVAVLGAGAGVGSTLFALVTPGELQKQSMLQVETTGLPEVCVGRGPVFWPRMQASFLPAGDAGKGLETQGRSGQDPGTGDGYPEGRRGHEGERGLEEKLDS